MNGHILFGLGSQCLFVTHFYGGSIFWYFFSIWILLEVQIRSWWVCQVLILLFLINSLIISREVLSKIVEEWEKKETVFSTYLLPLILTGEGSYKDCTCLVDSKVCTFWIDSLFKFVSFKVERAFKKSKIYKIVGILPFIESAWRNVCIVHRYRL